MKGLKNTNENIEKISANIFELIREFPFQSAKNDSFFGLIIHSSSAISNNSNNQSGKRKRSEIDSSSSLSHVNFYLIYLLFLFLLRINLNKIIKIIILFSLLIK